MNIKFSIYDKTSGKIRIQGSMEDTYIPQQLGSNEDVIYQGSTVTQYVDVDTKTLIDMPIKLHEYSVFDYATKQWQDSVELATQDALSKRLVLLQQSDWTDTASAVTRLPNYQQWQDYRQALRDVTQQSGYPLNIIWPEQPQ